MTLEDEVPLSFRLGSSNREHVVVRPSHRERPGASDYADGNWVCASIEIAAGAFRGRIDSASLRAEDFGHFRDQLRPLYERLVGKAAFHTMEDWLRIDIDGDGKGHFRAVCEATDMPGTGNRLTFELELEQTDLPALIRALDQVCAAFPVVGRKT